MLVFNWYAKPPLKLWKFSCEYQIFGCISSKASMESRSLLNLFHLRQVLTWTSFHFWYKSMRLHSKFPLSLQTRSCVPISAFVFVAKCYRDLEQLNVSHEHNSKMSRGLKLDIQTSGGELRNTRHVLKFHPVLFNYSRIKQIVLYKLELVPSTSLHLTFDFKLTKVFLRVKTIINEVGKKISLQWDWKYFWRHFMIISWE